MARLFALILCFLLFGIGGTACASESESESLPKSLTIEFVISEPCSVVKFVDILSERNHTTTWVRDWYHKKEEQARQADSDSFHETEHLARYKKLMNGGAHNYSFTDQTGREMNLDDQLIAVSARCTTMPELYSKLHEMLADDDAKALREVLEYFAPKHRQFIWNSGLPILKKQVEEIKRSADETKMSERLYAVAKFMNASWPENLPFTVVLSPLPEGKHNTHGQSLGSVQTVELRPKESLKVKQNELSVIFHEDVHALWFAKKDMSTVDREFVVPGKGRLPLTEVYEGMATAIGQGWFHEKAFSRQPSHWYHDPLIEGYSRAVYPLYAEYLDSGKTLDSAFARKATEIYFEKFAAMANEMSVTSELHVIADQLNTLPDLKQDIEKQLPRLRELTMNAPIDSDKTAKALKDIYGGKVVVLLPPSKIDLLASINVPPVEIDSLKTLKQGWKLSMIEDVPFLFCIGATPTDQSQIVFRVLQMKSWPAPGTNGI